jgi:hypothetical protein
MGNITEENCGLIAQQSVLISKISSRVKMPKSTCLSNPSINAHFVGINAREGRSSSLDPSKLSPKLTIESTDIFSEEEGQSNALYW